MANRQVATTALDSMYLVIDNSSNPNADTIRIKITDFFASPEIDALIELASDVSDYLPLAGGTMTGDLVLAGDPTAALEAATKQYVDTMLPLAGGTMTGDITFSGGADMVGPSGGLIDVLADGGFAISSDSGAEAEGYCRISNLIAYMGYGDDYIDFSENQVRIYHGNDVVFHALAGQMVFGEAAHNAQFRSLKNYTFTDIPNYADDAAADADAGLESKALYTTTAGARAVYRKP